ncbi:MAG: Fe-S cluster assembly sulfur transfer protein SufU [Bacteroidota bacterium]
MNRDPKALYHRLILQHSKTPHNYTADAEADEVLEAYNPLCGDRFKVYIQLKDNRLQQISFDGYGCAISKASTSILAKKLVGLTLEEAEAVCTTFKRVVEEGDTQAEEEFAAFARARDFPGRDQCALLSWEEMDDFLAQQL